LEGVVPLVLVVIVRITHGGGEDLAVVVSRVGVLVGEEASVVLAVGVAALVAEVQVEVGKVTLFII